MTKSTPPKANKPNKNVTKAGVPKTDTNTQPVIQSTDIQPINQTIVSIEDIQAQYEEKLKKVEEKLKNVELSLGSQIETLFKVLKQKDDVIGQLNVQIGELKKSCDFLSNETADLKNNHQKSTKMFENKIETTGTFVQEIKSKTVDLEDRSRRDNLVFFNFQEIPDKTPDNCEQYINDLVYKLGILPDDEVLYVDRAHRLGRKTPENMSDFNQRMVKI